jgi:thiamine biosynthesis protein ThiI
MRFMIRLSSDITTKAHRTRRRFTRMVMDNVRDALTATGIGGEVLPGYARLFAASDSERAAEVIAHVFGVHSVSRVDEIEAPSLEALLDAATAYFQPHLNGGTFAVRARCARPSPFRSSEVERELGARLVPFGKVHLDDPQVTCHVEVREGHTYLYLDSVRGPRGLPIGSEGHAISLLSGGFDSAISSWMMLRRGVALDYVVCRLGGPAHVRGATGVLRILGQRWSFGSRPRVLIVPFEEVADQIRARCRPSTWQLMLKRCMYRTAQEMARRTRSQAIITGESIGQVSSQTLKNIRALEANLRTPILRPLVGMDKDEIMQRCREIGTWEVSALVKEYCAISEFKPMVAARIEDVAREEEKLDIDWGALCDASPRYEVRDLPGDEAGDEDLEIDEIPDGAVVLDLRDAESFRAWHYPDAVRIDLDDALGHVGRFDSDRTYVVVCPVGLKSAHLAARLRQAGRTAYNFRGGFGGLLRFAAARQIIPEEMVSTELWL